MRLWGRQGWAHPNPGAARALRNHVRAARSPAPLAWRDTEPRDASFFRRACNLRPRRGDSTLEANHSHPEPPAPGPRPQNTESRALLFSKAEGSRVPGPTTALPANRSPPHVDAPPQQRRNWRIRGAGYGIHWPDLDEDLSTAGLLRELRTASVLRPLRGRSSRIRSQRLR